MLVENQGTMHANATLIKVFTDVEAANTK